MCHRQRSDLLSAGAASFSSLAFTVPALSALSAMQSWTLEEGCALTPSQKGEILVRHKGNSTLWAIARGHMSKSVMVILRRLLPCRMPAAEATTRPINGSPFTLQRTARLLTPLHFAGLQWGFTVRFPPGNPHYRDPLRLCFEDEATALEWHTSFARVIGCSSAAPRSLSDNDAHRRLDEAEAEDDDKEALLPRTATAPSPNQVAPLALCQHSLATLLGRTRSLTCHGLACHVGTAGSHFGADPAVWLALRSHQR